MRWTTEPIRGKVAYLHPGVMGKPRRRLRWRWYRCWPLVAIGTSVSVAVLSMIMQAWLLGTTPREVWMDTYHILSLWR